MTDPQNGGTINSESLNLTQSRSWDFFDALTMIKKISKFGPILFFIIQPVILLSMITLTLFGRISSQVGLLFFGAISLEAIYIAFFIRMKLNRSVHLLNEVERQLAQVKEDALHAVRMQREVIYAGHQIKTLQMDLEALKKGIPKLSGSGHSRRIHI